MVDWTLAIDTSTPRAFVALVGGVGASEEGRVIEEESRSGNSHHEELAPLVKLVLRGAGVEERAVSRVVVGAGPGSFTGLRIGYSFARGIAVGLGVPMFGVSSFLGAAWELRGEGKPVVVASDAGRGELFVGVYRPEGEALATVQPPTLLPASALQGCVRGVLGHTDVHYLGVGGLQGDGFHLPKRVALGLCGAFRAENRHDMRPIDVEPEYLRAVAAKTIQERVDDRARTGKHVNSVN